MRILVLMILIAALCPAQVKEQPWQELVYVTDGFALTAPYPPLPHADAEVRNTNTYTIYLPDQKNVGLTLRVMHDQHDCKATLQLLRNGITGKQSTSAASSRVDVASIKDVSINGHPGLEYQWQVDVSTTGFDRHYCVNRLFYIFSATWPKRMTLPPVVKRVMDTFRLVQSEPHN
jgi:hypothetical protein